MVTLRILASEVPRRCGILRFYSVLASIYKRICWVLNACISSTIFLAPTIAKQAAVRVGLHAFCVGITPHPPMNKLSNRQTLQFLSTTDCPSSCAPARVVPQICNAAPGARNWGSPPGRKSPSSDARLTMLQKTEIRGTLFRTGSSKDLLLHHCFCAFRGFFINVIVKCWLGQIRQSASSGLVLPMGVLLEACQKRPEHRMRTEHSCHTLALRIQRIVDQ